MKRFSLFALMLALFYVTIGSAQQYPMMDMVAGKVIQKIRLRPVSNCGRRKRRRLLLRSKNRTRSRC